MKKILTAFILALTLTAHAGEVYKVLRNDPAFTIETQTVEMCNYTGSRSMPICEKFEQKLRVSKTGYNVIVVKEGTTVEKYFYSEKPFDNGSLLRLTVME